MGPTILFIKDYFDEYHSNRLVLFNNQSSFIRWSAYIVVFVALGHDVFEFTTKGFLSLFCIFLVLTYLLPFVPFAESQRSIISFFAKYSFMAFLFHHQALVAMKAKMTLKCAPEYVVYMVVSSFLISYLLAYVFYRPAECLKRAVFGPYKERKASV